MKKKVKKIFEERKEFMKNIEKKIKFKNISKRISKKEYDEKLSDFNDEFQPKVELIYLMGIEHLFELKNEQSASSKEKFQQILDVNSENF